MLQIQYTENAKYDNMYDNTCTRACVYV